MKKAVLLLLIAALLLACACGKNASIAPVVSPTPTPTSGAVSAAKPTVNTGGSNTNPTPAATTAATTAPSAAPTVKSNLYDPSIYVIRASDTWQTELAKGYYANCSCDIYLQKVDSNNNRVVAGSYEGYFWMKMDVDASDYIKEMLKNVPVVASFLASGDVLADNLAVSISAEDDKKWVDYTIQDGNGNPLPLTRDTPVGKGSFVAVTKNVYLEAHARGVQGEKVDYTDHKDGKEVDFNYVIHVDPDSSEQSAVRKVTIHFSGQNFDRTITGTLTRLPGYPDDVAKYTTDNPYQQALNQHLK